LNLISTRCAFSSAYLKGEEAGVISAGHVDEMLKKSTTQDILEAIGDTDIGGYLREQTINTFNDADQYLWRYLGKWLCMDVLKKIPHRHFVFSLPKILRRYFLYDRKLLAGLSRWN